MLAGRPLTELLPELSRQLVEGATFYRGTRATTIFEQTPTAVELNEVRALLGSVEISWDGAYGEPEIEPGLALQGIAYLGLAPHPTVAPLPARERPQREIALSENARSLVADFAGARSDLARRRRGPRRHDPPPAVAIAPAESAPTVLFHRGTLRGGQSLANLGHIVVVGDVNPGAELVAGGDIVVFGSLRGVAHAGAQGDRSARVYALVLDPTQLRIATSIATSLGEPALPLGAQVAFLAEDESGIAVKPA